MNEDNLDIIKLIIAILFPAISAGYTFCTNCASKREQKKLQEEQQRLRESQADIEAVGQYRHIKELERFFKEDLQKLIISCNSDEKEKIYAAVITCYSSFTDLFNEVNLFCALMNNDAITSEKVLRNTGINLVVKLADDQCEVFERLKEAADKSGHKNEIKRPDWDAYEEYDKFLQSRMSASQWRGLSEKRKKVGLKL